MARACRKYELSLKAGAISARSDGDVQAQLTHYREAQERTRARDNQVKQLLYERGVSMCYIVNYCNFARRLSRVCSEYQAATRRNLVQMALDRWTAKGLDRKVLLAIAEEGVGVGG
jgi:tRNA 2-selenouridine synthase SelU